MPWGDGTGPWWLSRRGVGGLGYGRNPWCMGRGFWARGGSWRGRAYAFAPRYDPFREPAPAEELGYLEDIASQLEQDLRDIKDRIEKLRSTQ